LTAGHVNKLIGPSREKRATTETLYMMLGALGLGVVLVEDPAATKRMAGRWQGARKAPSRMPERSPLLAGNPEPPRVNFDLLNWQPPPAERERPL
jgi:hypothetical protein